VVISRLCPICRTRDLLVGEVICPDCVEPEEPGGD
jgi:hypothetical protein